MRKKIVVHTNDGGETWTTQLELENSYDSIFFLNRNDGWLVGEAVLHTDDGGQTWNIKTSDDFSYSLKKSYFCRLVSVVGQLDIRATVCQACSARPMLVRTWDTIFNNWKAKLVVERLRPPAN